MDRILALVKQFHGYGYETAGLVDCFFEDRKQAEACAGSIRALKYIVEVYGSMIVIFY